MNTNIQQLKIGQKVRIIVDPPGGIPVKGTVKVIQDIPGKIVGIELDHFADYAHSLDQLVGEKIDSTRGLTVGKGWWTLAENLEIL